MCWLSDTYIFLNYLSTRIALGSDAGNDYHKYHYNNVFILPSHMLTRFLTNRSTQGNNTFIHPLVLG
jgi:hypothetical protein